MYDMAGNVWEFTTKSFPLYESRVIRGGGYAQDGMNYPAAERNYGPPDDDFSGYGFRVVLCIK